MHIDDNGKKYLARPSGWDKKGVEGAFKRFAATKYEITDDDGKLVSTVEYDGKNDNIIITSASGTYSTTHKWLKPYEFKYKDKDYLIYESVTGKIIIRESGKVVAKGSWGFKQVVFEEHNGEIEEILKEIATGYCIKAIVWFMFV
jgi:hypothetical protein